ncbi:MAG: peroxiredoxin, partial [Pseudomonadota bacterium]
AFTALAGEFDAAGVKVFGVSKDPVRKLDRFRDKHGLGVPLLSDEDSGTCEAYGVWKEKSMYGKTYMGIERSTVLIDGDGRVARFWPKVKVPGHAEEVLEAARGL